MTISGSYTCSGGESFDSIALALFGSEQYAAELMSANPESCLVTRFQGGEVLRIPEIGESEGAMSEVSTARSRAPWRE